MKTVIPMQLDSRLTREVCVELTTHFDHRDPLSQQHMSIGFIGVEHFDDHVHKFTVKQTKRVVPASAVKRMVKEKSDKWFNQIGYAPGRKTLREFKDQAIEELMSKAILSDSLHTVYCVKDMALFSSKAAMEFFADALKRITDDPVYYGAPNSVTPIKLSASVGGLLSSWATGESEPPEHLFQIGEQIKAKGNGSSLNFRSPSILSEFPKVANPERHVLALEMLSDHISFVLNSTFILTSVKIAPEFREGDLLTATVLYKTVNNLIEVIE